MAEQQLHSKPLMQTPHPNASSMFLWLTALLIVAFITRLLALPLIHERKICIIVVSSVLKCDVGTMKCLVSVIFQMMKFVELEQELKRLIRW